MKSPAAYYLMLIYITIMLKPLFPIASDWWAHEFNETEHLSYVHALMGTNHLDKQLAETNADDKNSKNQSILKLQEQHPYHVATDEYKFEFASHRFSLEYVGLFVKKLAFVIIPNPGPPPKVSL